jgi:hypothetical protein
VRATPRTLRSRHRHASNLSRLGTALINALIRASVIVVLHTSPNFLPFLSLQSSLPPNPSHVPRKSQPFSEPKQPLRCGRRRKTELTRQNWWGNCRGVGPFEVFALTSFNPYKETESQQGPSMTCHWFCDRIWLQNFPTQGFTCLSIQAGSSIRCFDHAEKVEALFSGFGRSWLLLMNHHPRCSYLSELHASVHFNCNHVPFN